MSDYLTEVAALDSDIHQLTDWLGGSSHVEVIPVAIDEPAATLTAMPKSFSGGCACGAIRYEVDAEPVLMVNCHCRACQRASGGAYGTGLIVATAAVRIVGEPRWHESLAESGSMARRGFCGGCGSPLFAASTATGAAAMSIKAASLDDPSWFRVQADIWTKAAQPWACTDPAVPKFETIPTRS